MSEHPDHWTVTRADSWHVELTVFDQPLPRSLTNREARRLAWALLAAAEQGDGQ